MKENDRSENILVKRSNRLEKQPRRLIYICFSYVVLIAKDFPSPRNFHKIKDKSKADGLYEASNKELDKMYNIVKMSMVNKSEIDNHEKNNSDC
eukprot:snap_masked-scaffold_39-processed-gene-2.9-mRNA-1 protein AED:1.00 eAED:1.00 QI:0/0/0/0/1/1/2/0/93